MPNACEHRNFNALVAVSRFEDLSGIYMADVQVSCADCGQAMQFVGLPLGLLWDRPAGSVDGCEAHLPLRPFVKPEWLPEEAHRMGMN